MPHEYLYRQIKVWQWRLKRFVKYRVLHVDDTPHRIALGVAVGFFVAVTPTQGFQMLAVVLLCALLRANKLVGMPIVWLSNPFTLVPVYYPIYRLGVLLTPGAQLIKLKQWRNVAAEIFHHKEGFWHSVRLFWDFGVDIAVPLWAGGIIVGLVLGGIMYWVTYRAVVEYRRRFAHWHPIRRMIRKHLAHGRHAADTKNHKDAAKDDQTADRN